MGGSSSSSLYALLYNLLDISDGSNKVHFRETHTDWENFQMALLTEFDIICVSQKAVKGQAIADLLADCPVEDYYPMNTVFPEEAVLSATKEEDELA